MNDIALVQALRDIAKRLEYAIDYYDGDVELKLALSHTLRDALAAIAQWEAEQNLAAVDASFPP